MAIIYRNSWIHISGRFLIHYKHDNDVIAVSEIYLQLISVRVAVRFGPLPLGPGPGLGASEICSPCKQKKE